MPNRTQMLSVELMREEAEATLGSMGTYPPSYFTPAGEVDARERGKAKLRAALLSQPEHQGDEGARLRAIGKALFYGLAPSRLYESEPHYTCSYWRHLGMNLALALRWATRRETTEDRDFERETGRV